MPSRSVTRTWYRVALARADATRALVVAQGEHLGVAIAAAEKHANGYAIAAEHVANDAVPLGESVGKQHAMSVDDTPELHELSTFHWPVGVVPQLGRATSLAGARTGYAIVPDDQLLVIEAQTDADQLTDLFLGLIERLPAADNLEIRLLDHFEDADATDVWLTSRINAKKTLRFLDDHDDELLGNGHLELSVYVRAHKATLRLTEHKTVVWLAEDGALRDDVTTWMKELGVPRIDEPRAIVDVPHFHYRPAKSRDRKKLGDELYRQRLRRVATVPRDAPADLPRGERPDTAG